MVALHNEIAVVCGFSSPVSPGSFGIRVSNTTTGAGPWSGRHSIQAAPTRASALTCFSTRSDSAAPAAVAGTAAPREILGVELGVGTCVQAIGQLEKTSFLGFMIKSSSRGRVLLNGNGEPQVLRPSNFDLTTYRPLGTARLGVDPSRLVVGRLGS